MASKPAKGKPLSMTAKLNLLAHGLHSLERGALPASGTALSATLPLAATDTRSITFTVSNTTDSVRISIVDDPTHPEVVVPAGAKTGTSKPRPNGSLIDFIVELLGSPGSSADVAITNSEDSKITPSIPNDFKESWYPVQYTTKTKW